MEASTGCIAPYITQTTRIFLTCSSGHVGRISLTKTVTEGRKFLPLWDPESRANYLPQGVKVGKIEEERPTAITLHQPSNFTATSTGFLAPLPGRCKSCK